MFVYLDVMIELFCVVFFKGIFFVVDLLVFSLIILDFSVVGDEYYCVVQEVIWILQCYKDFQDIIVIFGIDELLEEDKQLVNCVWCIEWFLLQNMMVVEQFIGQLGLIVLVKEIIEVFDCLCKGDFDYVFEQVFFLIGGFDDLVKKVESFGVKL